MDGNTWFRYRWVTHRGDDSPFYLEPWNSQAYPAFFLNSGFRPIAEYESSLVSDLSIQDPRLPKLHERLMRNQVQFRPLDLERLEMDLQALHELSLAAFKDNLFYTPIELDTFMSLYLPFRDAIRPEFTLLAFHESTLIGFCFALPDAARLNAGYNLDTLIIKTIAVRPDRRFAGLGSWMVEQMHLRAAKAGMNRVIHALKAVSNRSQNITTKYRGSCLRQYQLFAKSLEV